MNKIEITIEGPYLEVKINGIVQDHIRAVKLDAIVIEGVTLSMKSLIYPQNQKPENQDLKGDSHEVKVYGA